MIDTVERSDIYQIGDATHYGPVLSLLPPFATRSVDVDQGIVVKVDPASVSIKPIESVNAPKLDTFNKIRYFPVRVNWLGNLTSSNSG